MGIGGMRLWFMTLVEYDNVGNATVLKSYMKPAIDSTAKYDNKKKKVARKPKRIESEEKQLWE